MFAAGTLESDRDVNNIAMAVVFTGAAQTLPQVEANGFGARAVR
jgi:hypothetical protein